MQVERVEAQHEEESEGATVDGDGLAVEKLAKQQDGEHDVGTN